MEQLEINSTSTQHKVAKLLCDALASQFKQLPNIKSYNVYTDSDTFNIWIHVYFYNNIHFSFNAKAILGRDDLLLRALWYMEDYYTHMIRFIDKVAPYIKRFISKDFKSDYKKSIIKCEFNKEMILAGFQGFIFPPNDICICEYMHKWSLHGKPVYNSYAIKKSRDGNVILLIDKSIVDKRKLMLKTMEEGTQFIESKKDSGLYWIIKFVTEGKDIISTSESIGIS